MEDSEVGRLLGDAGRYWEMLGDTGKCWEIPSSGHDLATTNYKLSSHGYPHKTYTKSSQVKIRAEMG